MDTASLVVATVVIGAFAFPYLLRATTNLLSATTNAADNAADSTELAAYQRQCRDADKWIFDRRIRGVPPEMICGSVPAGVDHDERVLCVLPGVDLMEPRAVRRSSRFGRSASSGPTMRFGGGLSYRFSSGESTGFSESESSDELRQIDHGTLILTTKRLAFLGSLRTNSGSLEDLIGITASGYGIQVHRERKPKVETYMLTNPLCVDGQIITGSMIQLTIEMAKLAQEVDELEEAPPAARAEWVNSPFLENRGNPLQDGSLHA